MPSRVFTPRSARRALAKVVPAAEALRSTLRRLETRRPEAGVAESPVDPDYFRDLVRARTLAGALGDAGIRIVDSREGILEFPARREGSPVWLRFRLGDRDLVGWRPAGGGMSDPERPLDEEGPWDEPSGRGPL